MSSRQPGSDEIHVGVAGWDYPDWVGPVYPARAGARFDRLAWLARYVDVIEINSSFYRPPEPRVADSWVQRTATLPDFRFTAKAHRSWTHEPVPDADGAVRATLTGLEPLRAAGRLGALLVQFPQSFHHGPAALERLDALHERTAGWPVVVEVRHVSWESEEAARWFVEREVGWCLVDQPRVGSSTARPLPRVTSSVGYLRLHGRNARDWFRPDAGRDARYDYLYTPDQLRPLASAARAMAEQAEQLFVIQNNHFRGQALANTLQLKHLLENCRPEAPEQLVDAFPELEEVTEVRRSRLF